MLSIANMPGCVMERLHQPSSNIVPPTDDKQRIDDIVARNTTRSAFLTDVLNRAAHE